MQQSVTGVYLETLVDGSLVHLRPIVVHLILVTLWLPKPPQMCEKVIWRQ